MEEVGGILNSQGWYLSSEGLAQCLELCKEKGWKPTARNVEKVALNCDLRSAGTQSLSDDIVRNLEHQVKGPIVLQIQKVKNVALPSTKQYHPSPSRRLLRLQLTDGHVYCSAVETEGAVDSLSTSIPPGTKVRLVGTMAVQNSFILLKKTSVEVLGGSVEHLVKKWNMQKIVPDNVERRREGVAGPPPFVSFKDSRRDVQSKMPSKSDLRSSDRKPGNRTEVERRVERVKTEVERRVERVETEVERSTDSSRVETGTVRSAFTSQTSPGDVKAARGRGRGAGFGEESRRVPALTEPESRVQHGRGKRSDFQREDQRDNPSVGRGRGGRRHQYSTAERMPEVGKQARSEHHPSRGFSGHSNEGERYSAAQRPQHSRSLREVDTRGQSSGHQLSEWLEQKLKLDSEVFSIAANTAREGMEEKEPPPANEKQRPHFKGSSRYEDEKQREGRLQKEDERLHKSHYGGEAHRERYRKEEQHDRPGSFKDYERRKPFQQSERGERRHMDTKMQGDGQRRERVQRREFREGKRETRPSVREAWADLEDHQSRSSGSRTVGGDFRTKSTVAGDFRTKSTAGGDSRTKSTVSDDSRTVTVGSGGSDQYNWDWVNKGAPCSASKHNH